MAEMSSMGIGNKPCLDIRPSGNQISDRSISFAQLSRSKCMCYLVCSFYFLHDAFLTLDSRCLYIRVVHRPVACEDDNSSSSDYEDVSNSDCLNDSFTHNESTFYGNLFRLGN